MTEKVLIEINRLKNELDGYSAREALDYIESYINTLSKQQVEEPVPAQWGAEHLADARKTSPKGLEEAAREYGFKEYRRRCNGGEYGTSEDAFIAGTKWQKEQMMKEAVEGEVCGRVYDHINVRFADGVCKFLEPKNISHIPANVSKYKVGDKVRIIIVKE